MPSGWTRSSLAESRASISVSTTPVDDAPRGDGIIEKRIDQRYYMVDYIFPLDNAEDTRPGNPKGVDMELRGAQIRTRLTEIEEARHVLDLINQGRGDEVAARNLRKKGNVGSSAHGLAGITWSDWAGRLYLEKVTVMGHSFGGATTVQMLRLDERFDWIGQGVLLDAWGPAIPEPRQGCNNQISKPLMSIGSEAFMLWRTNYDRVEGVCTEAREKGLAWMMTIRGSTHLSYSDFAHLYPHWMSLLMKTMAKPERGLNITVGSTLEFLKIALPPDHTRFGDVWVDEHLLMEAEPLDTIPMEHMPDDRWIGGRLKIHHEFRKRARAWFHRRKHRADNRADKVPGAEAGPVPPELRSFSDGKEVWMHLAPTNWDVGRYMESNGWASDRRRSWASQCSTAV